MSSGADLDDRLDLSDISWLTADVDVEAALDRLRVHVTSRRGNEIWGFCPDHHLFTGHQPSHPKWSINRLSGKSNCFTESRGSNLVWITARLKELSGHEAASWLLQDSVDSFRRSLNNLKRAVAGLFPEADDTFDATKFEQQLKETELEAPSVNFLAKHGIRPDAAQRFGCVQFPMGYYENRIVFPVRSVSQQLVGFVATDVLGQERWLKEHPHWYDSELRSTRPAEPGDYRKVLYPRGFSVGQHLMGVHDTDMTKGAFLVEGFRDMLKLRQEGFLGSLALGGSSVSDAQVELLSKLGTKRVVVLMDGDEAGRQAAPRVAQKCCKFFDDVYVTDIDNNRDPKDLTKAELLYLLKTRTTRAQLKKNWLI